MANVNNQIAFFGVNGTFRTTKPATKAGFNLSGEGGIRTPGPVTVNSFQDCRNRPLCHLSIGKIR